MILPSGVVYTVNRIGPITDPCGTPYFSVTGSEVLDQFEQFEVYPGDMIWTTSERPL